MMKLESTLRTDMSLSLHNVAAVFTRSDKEYGFYGVSGRLIRNLAYRLSDWRAANGIAGELQVT